MTLNTKPKKGWGLPAQQDIGPSTQETKDHIEPRQVSDFFAVRIERWKLAESRNH